jgi:hypothetical protein
MQIVFTKEFMMGFGKNGKTVFYSSEYDLSFVETANRYPRKNPITLGQAISIQQDYIHALCEEGKFQEAGKFASKENLLDWISIQGFHIEISKKDFDVLTSSPS